MTKKWCSIVATAAFASAQLVAQGPPQVDPLATRVDPLIDRGAHHHSHGHRQRAGRSDVDGPAAGLLERAGVEGLVASTSTWMRERVRPDVILKVIDAYEQVRPALLKHQSGFPAAAALRGLVASGQPGYGMAAVGPDNALGGAALILRAADRADARPLWVLGWGGANTLAEALLHARATRSPPELDALISRLRVYTISDQDDAGPWIRREFPRLHYIVSPSTPDGSSTTSRRGPASAAIASTAMRQARTSPPSPIRGWTPISAAEGRSASCTRNPVASTKATRRRSSG